jgi:predicted dehydrogenase
VHLVDLALWMYDFPEVVDARSTLLRDGRPVASDAVENYATDELRLANGVHVRLACSWNLNAGADAVIEASFYGTEGGAQMRNVEGSFFDFSADLLKGQAPERIAAPPDDWGGRAAAQWVRKLAAGERFAGSTSGLIETARALDRLYGR